MVKTVGDPYRPALHYMRGPGPKWHAKHQGRVESGALGPTGPETPVPWRVLCGARRPPHPHA